MINLYISSFCLMLIGLAEPEPPSLESKCGSFCLTVAFKALDSKISFETIEKKLGDPPLSGYSMNHLKETAEFFNFTTTVSLTTLENLRWRKEVFGERFVCLTIIRNDHYVLLNEVEDSTVSICDPPHIDKLDNVIFDRIWSGNSLLISNKPLVTEEEIVNRRKRWMIVRISGLSIFFVVFVIVFGVTSQKLIKRQN